MTTETEIAVMHLQTRECRDCPKLGRGKTKLYPRAVTESKAPLVFLSHQFWCFVLAVLGNECNGISGICFIEQFIVHGKVFFFFYFYDILTERTN